MYLFSEMFVKSACLNSAQNLQSDIKTQKDNFVSLSDRLIEVERENSSDSMPYGIYFCLYILQGWVKKMFFFCNIK